MGQLEASISQERIKEAERDNAKLSGSYVREVKAGQDYNNQKKRTEAIFKEWRQMKQQDLFN